MQSTNNKVPTGGNGFGEQPLASMILFSRIGTYVTSFLTLDAISLGLIAAMIIEVVG